MTDLEQQEFKKSMQEMDEYIENNSKSFFKMIEQDLKEIREHEENNKLEIDLINLKNKVNEKEEIYTIQECCKYLGFTRQHLHQCIKNGTLKAVIKNNKNYIPQSEIIKFMLQKPILKLRTILDIKHGLANYNGENQKKITETMIYNILKLFEFNPINYILSDWEDDEFGFLSTSKQNQFNDLNLKEKEIKGCIYLTIKLLDNEFKYKKSDIEEYLKLCDELYKNNKHSSLADLYKEYSLKIFDYNDYSDSQIENMALMCNTKGRYKIDKLGCNQRDLTIIEIKNNFIDNIFKVFIESLKFI